MEKKEEKSIQYFFNNIETNKQENILKKAAKTRPIAKRENKNR